MNKIAALLILVITLAVVMVSTRPLKWKSDFLGMNGDTVFEKLGEPDQSNFEEFYWVSSFSILGLELFGSYLRLGISPGQDQLAIPIVLSQSYGYTFSGRDIFPARE